MTTPEEPPADMQAVERASEVREAYESELLARANVIGVGVGYRHKKRKSTPEVALIVMVRKKVPRAELATEDVIPSSIEGVPVDVREMGELDAHGG